MSYWEWWVISHSHYSKSDCPLTSNQVKTLLPLTLNHLPFLQERLAAQKSTIATMQQQAKVSEQLMATERERHAVERESWHKEMRAVMVSKEEEKVSSKRKVLDLDVGYHKELEAANKRLEMDNRLMAPRVRLVIYLMARANFPLVG